MDLYSWDLKGPPDAEPLALKNGEVNFQHEFAIHPEGLWLVTAEDTFGILWPLHPRYSRVLRARSLIVKVLFAEDGTSLLSGAEDGTVRLWPLSPREDDMHRLLMSTGSGANVATDPAGKQALVAGAFDSRVVLAPRDELEIGPFPGWAKVPEWQS